MTPPPRREKVIDALLLAALGLGHPRRARLLAQLRQHLAITSGGKVASLLLCSFRFEQVQLLMQLRQAGTQPHPPRLLRQVVHGKVCRHGVFGARVCMVPQCGLQLGDCGTCFQYLRRCYPQRTLLCLFLLLPSGQHRGEWKGARHGLGGKRYEQSRSVGEGAQLPRFLAQEGLQRGQHLQGTIQLRVGPALVGADAHQVFGASVGAQQRP